MTARFFLAICRLFSVLFFLRLLFPSLNLFWCFQWNKGDWINVFFFYVQLVLFMIRGFGYETCSYSISNESIRFKISMHGTVSEYWIFLFVPADSKVTRVYVGQSTVRFIKEQCRTRSVNSKTRGCGNTVRGGFPRRTSLIKFKIKLPSFAPIFVRRGFNFHKRSGTPFMRNLKQADSPNCSPLETTFV